MDDNRACHIRSFDVEEAASLFTEVRGEGVFSEVRLNGVLRSSRRAGAGGIML